MPIDDTLEHILEQARWAPSGDNTQPWRFQVKDARHMVVHGFDTREHCVYDLDGHPSQISLGALLETIAIAASVHALRCLVQRRTTQHPSKPTFDIAFESDPQLQADPLAAFITLRSVQRRALRTRALTLDEKATLEQALPPGFQLLWLEGLGQRLACARLMFNNAKLRLTMPEAHLVHGAVIEWNARFSSDRIPDQALGVDPMTAKLMRWIMHSWRRVEFFNTFLAGTLLPRIQMDLFPALACAAHVVLVADASLDSIDDYIAGGRAMQRFWLSATRLGLQMQPEMTPLIFARYVRERRVFSGTHGMHARAANLAARYAALIGLEVAERAVFMARIGAGAAATARSTRRPLSELIVPRAQ